MRHVFVTFLQGLIFASVSVLPAVSEGAILRFDCRETAICQSDGTCQSDHGQTVFTLAPQEIDADGRGDYLISSDGGDRRPATGTARTGPYVWTDRSGQERVLTILSESAALLVSRDPSAPDATTVSFLSCSIIF
ncbi:hypothetical protein ACRARG_00970 [Pseudooceanicola sp. C21-150M6]|uniref:hypothetical protein n=1 Tax=Pseudooceanicola sp. C21-150M6 TaxID=3434355 RepID=UPI003D7FB6F8